MQSSPLEVSGPQSRDPETRNATGNLPEVQLFRPHQTH